MENHRIYTIAFGLLATAGIAVAANQIGMPVATTGKPSCDEAHRGLSWMTPVIDGGLSDVVERCQVVGGDFTWVDITSPAAVDAGSGGGGGGGTLAGRVDTDSSDQIVWAFDELPGETTVVNSGVASSSDLTMPDSTRTGHPGVFERAGYFPNSNSGIGEGPTSTEPSDVTVSAWVYPYASPQDNYAKVVYKQANTGSTWSSPYVAFALQYNSTGTTPECSVAVGGNLKCLPGLPYSLGPYQWHHYGCTYDGTTLRMYVDGVEAASGLYDWGGSSCSSTPHGGGEPDYDDHGPWRLGNSPEAEYYAGLIDDVRIANVVRPGSWFAEVFSRGIRAAGSVGVTNSAGANVVMKSDGTNAVASTVTDDGTTVTVSGALSVGTVLNRTAPDGDDLLVYTFDQAAGTTVTNSGVVDGGNLTATESSMLGLGGGMFDRSIRVNSGSGQYVSAGGETVTASAPVTLSAWFQPDATIGSYGKIVHKLYAPNSTSGSHVAFGLAYGNTTSATGTWGCIISTGATLQCVSAPDTASIMPYQWNHIGCSYDGTDLRLYLNGRLIATGIFNWVSTSCSATPGSAGAIDWGTDGQWMMGASYGNIQGTNGYIDDVRFADVLRDEAWFTGVYKKGVGRE